MKQFTRGPLPMPTGEEQYRDLSGKLQGNARFLEGFLSQPVDSRDTVMIAEAYKQRGLIYLEIDELCGGLKEASEALISALKCFSQAITLDTDPNVTAFCLRKRASLNLARGLVNEGIEDYIAACRYAPKNSQAWFEYGKALINLKRYEESIEPLKRSLILRPLYVETQMLLETAIKKGRLSSNILKNIRDLIETTCTLAEKNDDKFKKSDLCLWLQAARLGNLELVKRLVPHVDTQIRDGLGNTAFHYAARFGRANLIPFLKDRVDLNTRNREGLTPVGVAIIEGNVGVVQALIDARAEYAAEALLLAEEVSQGGILEGPATERSLFMVFERHGQVSQKRGLEAERTFVFNRQWATTSRTH